MHCYGQSFDPNIILYIPLGKAGEIIRAEFNALNQELGIEFEAFSIVLPEGVTGPGGGGIAGIEGGYQFYGGGAERSLEVIMHGKFLLCLFCICDNPRC